MNSTFLRTAGFLIVSRCVSIFSGRRLCILGAVFFMFRSHGVS